MKWKYKSLIFLILMLCCVGSVCAVDIDNSTTINNGSVINSSSDLTDTDLNSNIVVLPFSHNSNSLNNNIIKTNSSVIIKTNNSHYNASETLKNYSITDLMNKSMYNTHIKLLLDNLDDSDETILLNNLTIKDIMNNLFKDDGVINLTSTINYIDYVLDYDIVQMRITLKTVKEYLVNLNVSKVNDSTVDNYLTPFMLGLHNKVGKLSVLGTFVNVLADYFKANTKFYQDLNDIITNKKVKHTVNLNDINHHIKQLTKMIAYLKFMKDYLESINHKLKLIDKEIKRV